MNTKTGDQTPTQKPARYVEDNITYYRASALGMCDRLFVALANDYQPLEHPEWFKEVLQEGTDSEASIIAMYETENPGIAITNQQMEVKLEILDDVWIVGHIDGVVTGENGGGGGDIALAEVKKFRASTWEKFLKNGVECQANYPMQVAAYMHATGFEDCAFIGGKYVDGEIVETYTHHLTAPPVPLLGIRKRVARLEALINEGANVMDVGCKVSYPCFVAGTPVLTSKGFKSIEEVTVGEQVLTHLGRWREVLEVMETPNVPTRDVKISHSTELTTTDDHPFLTRERYYHHYKANTSAIRKFREPEWSPADKLERRHFAAQVLPPEEESYIAPDMWWLIGRYLADGWKFGNSSVMICCAHKEAEFLESKIAALGFPVRRTEERTATKFRLGVAFRDIIEPFGKYAHGKKLTIDAMCLPQREASELLNGYLSGDGHFSPKREAWMVTSCSVELLHGMSIVAQRAWGVLPGFSTPKPAGTSVIEGRTVQTRESINMRIPTKTKQVHSFVEDGVGWSQVRHSIPTGKLETVFNLRVAEDESYTVANVVVHNCPTYYLHDDTTSKQDAVVRPGDDVIAPLLLEIRVLEEGIAMAKPGIKQLEERLKALKLGVHGWLEAMNVEDGQVATVKVGDDEWQAKYTTVNRGAYEVKATEYVKVSAELVSVRDGIPVQRSKGAKK